MDGAIEISGNLILSRKTPNPNNKWGQKIEELRNLWKQLTVHFFFLFDLQFLITDLGKPHILNHSSNKTKI